MTLIIVKSILIKKQNLSALKGSDQVLPVLIPGSLAPDVPLTAGL